MKNNIIFVGGIHGVGKTTFCNKISDLLGIKNYSSSDLIYKFNSDKSNCDKKVENISFNQDILLRAVDKYIMDPRIQTKKYLLFS